MDSLNFDGYTSYSDSSTPRTPSPTDMHFATNDVKHINLDIDRNIFTNNEDDTSNAVLVNPHDASYWSNQHPSANFTFTSNNPSRSVIPDIYDQDHNDFHNDQFQPQHENWSQHDQHHSNHHQRPSEFPMMRRATFPYVRHDREDIMPLQQYTPFIQHQSHQNQPHPEGLLYTSRQENPYGDLGHSETFIPSMTNSPHSSYNDFDENANIKLEDTTPIMVPSQSNTFYRQSPQSQCHPMTMTYLSPHTGLPVQHTDDAASKETQYLRRRCFNCHTTEPPSWRRSTLNPGKIVCNKCGLYERTHLRPRPLRFDELRAGNKARKQSGKGGPNGSGVSPKQSKLSMIKKEPREFGGGSLVRRSSMSSSSSVHSGSGASDWDDNVSIYSSGSAPPTSFNSPVVPSFPLSRDSHSPPIDGGIRLPNNPLSDIASMHISGQQSTPLLAPNGPRKSHTSPGFYASSLPSSSPAPQQQSRLSQDYFSSSDSVPEAPIWSAEPAAESNTSLVSSPASS